MERTFRSEVSEERVGDQLATVPIHTATMVNTSIMPVEEDSRGADYDQNDTDLFAESFTTPHAPVDIPITQTQVMVHHGPRRARKMKSIAVPKKDFEKLEDQKDQLIRELRNAQKAQQQFQTQGQMYKNNFENLTMKYDELNLDLKTVRKENACTKELCHLLEKDNELLRSVIANINSARQPLLNEDHYGREFDCLKGEIENWAVGQSKKSNPESFGQASMDEVINILESLGNYGKQSAMLLQSKLFMLYQYRPTRMALIRHVNGLFIFDKVLSRYTFGFSREGSNYHQEIEDRLFQQDLDFSKILMVRQALARSILNGLHIDRERERARCIAMFAQLQRALLPQSPENAIQEFVTCVLDKAITLRDALTMEQAIFRSYFVGVGDSYDKSNCEIRFDEEPVGKVFMCLFPGLQRRHIDNEKDIPCCNFVKIPTVTVVKAAVKLQSAFGAILDGIEQSNDYHDMR